MGWVIGVAAASAVLAGTRLVLATRPRVPAERVADEDLELVRQADRERWRRLRLGTYRSWKQNDDFYRIAAYRKLVAGGMPEADAKARVRRDFPIYYLDPASRDTEGYAGDDGALPVVLRERIDRNARVFKELMAEKEGAFRTMNALIRSGLRKGAL